MKDIKCRNYSLINKQCRLLYDNPFQIDINDLIPHCEGISNITKCAWFTTVYLTEIDLRQKRKELRRIRKEMGL